MRPQLISGRENANPNLTQPSKPQGLAHEGLSQWQEAVDCYTQSIDLGRSVAADEPYILNSRGNCFISLGYCLTQGRRSGLMLRVGHC
jgi:hypothetical protein